MATKKPGLYGSLEKRFYKPGVVIVGVDEVGRGCLAGPLTVAAAVLPPSLYIDALKLIRKCDTNTELWWHLNKSDSILSRIRDSKMVKEAERGRLSGILRLTCSAFAVANRSADFIDEFGMSRAFVSASTEAVQNTLKSTPGLEGATKVVCIIDGAQRFGIDDVETKSVPKADSLSWTVAAASIIAKTHRDSMMVEYHMRVDDRFGFDAHKGYSTQTHVTAIMSHGLCELHRRSFSMTLPDGHRKRLGDYDE